MIQGIEYRKRRRRLNSEITRCFSGRQQPNHHPSACRKKFIASPLAPCRPRRRAAARRAWLPVRIMSEDLVLFRGNDGQLGLIGQYCSHRRADLSYGRVEWRPALPVSWLVVRPPRPLHRTALRAAGPALLREGAPSRLPLPGTRRRCLCLPGTGRAAASAAQLRTAVVAPARHVLATKFYHECQSLSGQRRQSQSPARAFPICTAKPTCRII